MPEPVKPDPFTSTETRTVEVTGPIKITITTRYDSSHVPPTAEELYDAGKGTGERFVEALRPIAAAIMSKLDEILRAQNTPPEEH